MLALYGIGNIVGAGIYVLIGKIAEPAGYLSVAAFLLAAVVAFCAALSYAELAARFPVSAGIAVYLHKAFRRTRLATIVGLSLVVAGIVSTATLLKGFAGYIHTVVPLSQPVLMALMLAILVAIMLRGIKESVGTAVLLTVIEVGGLLILAASIFIAEPQTFSTYTAGFNEAWRTLDGAAWAGVIGASFIAFYAFVGFEDMVNIAEEVERPQHAYPRAIVAAMAVVTALYISVTVAALGVLSPEKLGSSQAPLADAFHAATGGNTGLIVIIGALATLNGVLVNIVMGSRFLYGLASRGWIVPWFGKLSRYHVPARSLLLVAFLALLGALWLPIEHLAQTASLFLILVFCAVNISLIVIRRHDGRAGAAPVPRISPAFMPWVGALLGGALLIGQLISVVASE